jgi:hypothetical protein
MKLDAAFNIVWNGTYANYSVFSAQESVDDGYLSTIAGSLIKTDLEGNIVWIYESNGFIRSAIQTKDGAYALTGSVNHPNTDTISEGDITGIMVERLSKPSITPSPTSSPEPIETWRFTTILVVAFIITVSVVGIGLLYFKKRKPLNGEYVHFRFLNSLQTKSKQNSPQNSMQFLYIGDIVLCERWYPREYLY